MDTETLAVKYCCEFEKKQEEMVLALCNISVVHRTLEVIFRRRGDSQHRRRNAGCVLLEVGNKDGRSRIYVRVRDEYDKNQKITELLLLASLSCFPHNVKGRCC